MLRCEIMAKLLSGIRAEVARELRTTYGLSQEEIAQKLKVTQGAVSQYLRKRRGKEILSPELKRGAKEIANVIMKGGDFEIEVCKLCKKLDLMNL